MNHFEYSGGELYAEKVRMADIAKTHGTPTYVYSAATLRRHFTAFDSAFEGVKRLICYSVKANSNLCVLKTLAAMGAGMDIVSGGELFRALAAGVSAQKIVYSGVGKTAAEIRQALEADILMFNVESMAELETIDAVAGSMGKIARVSLRINPDVDPKTHPYISTGMKKNKFGLDIETAMTGYKQAMKLANVEPIGMDCHIGSQLTQISPFIEALERLMAFHRKLLAMGCNIKYLDLGGGLGITYNEETPPHPAEYGKAVMDALSGTSLELILEPGRVIVGNAGVLMTTVTYVKSTEDKRFVIVDAAMNDLVRPSLYGSYHRIAEVAPKSRENAVADVVGPICESGDFLAKDREMPCVESGELLAVFSAGAYGFTMSSNYNSRPRAAEVLVDGDKMLLARRRETYEDLVALEKGCLEG